MNTKLNELIAERDSAYERRNELENSISELTAGKLRQGDAAIANSKFEELVFIDGQIDLLDAQIYGLLR